MNITIEPKFKPVYSLSDLDYGDLFLMDDDVYMKCRTGGSCTTVVGSVNLVNGYFYEFPSSCRVETPVSADLKVNI